MIEIIVNGIQFIESPYPEFRVYGDEDKFPFIDSFFDNVGLIIPFRTYKSLRFNNKFYVPYSETFKKD